MKVYKAMDEVMCEKDDWCEKRCELMKEEQKLISVITRGVKGWSRGEMIAGRGAAGAVY